MRSDMDKIITDTYCGGKSRSKGRNPIGREANLDYENLHLIFGSFHSMICHFQQLQLEIPVFRNIQ